MLNLVEPVALVAWALILILWQLWRQRVRGGTLGLVVVTFAFYFWFATPLGANLMVRAIEGDPDGGLECVEEDAPIVVLAGGVSGLETAVASLTRLKESTFRRTVAAVELAKRQAEPLLVVSGGAGGHTTEADLMRQLALALGATPERIMSDSESKSTCESAFRVAELLRGRGSANVQLVTSALHMRRAAWAFEAAGLTVCRHPVDWRQVAPDPGWLIPQISALGKSTEALREIVGLAWYRSGGCAE